jgi:DNA repair protein RadC
MKTHKTISEWSEESRPREKMVKYGANVLSLAELLAILIRSGQKDEDAVSLMNRILEENGNSLDRLCRLGYEDLIQYKGIGPAKAISLLAAIELAKRRASVEIAEEKAYDSPVAIYNLLVNKMRNLSTEVCYVLALDRHLHYMGDKQIALGGYTSTVVDPRVALRFVLSKNAVAMAIAHNHPSRVLKPSKEDDMLTMRVKKACEAVGIRFVDHLIVTGKGYYSYGEHDKL